MYFLNSTSTVKTYCTKPFLIVNIIKLFLTNNRSSFFHKIHVT